MDIVTRFAPSPTGLLHVGNLRTAIFNWLYAKANGGKFYLRIEDTDRARFSQENVEQIIETLHWLGLNHDCEIISQFSNRERHVEIARQLIDSDKAYYCYCTPERLATVRERARAEKKPIRYDGKCRNLSPTEPIQAGAAIRLKVPQAGETIVEDALQGRVVVDNCQLDDMILLRSDGVPTYMLAVVVDDHDMAISHIIRGVDHLTNAARQQQLYQALGWQASQFCHIPLIHSASGQKLSKRQGALSVLEYKKQGILPEALFNYLLRLGWSHGDDEIISLEQALGWFSLEELNKSAARFDENKLTALNAHYLRNSKQLLSLLAAELPAMSPADKHRLELSIDELKQRSKTVIELVELARPYLAEQTLVWSESAAELVKNSTLLLNELMTKLQKINDWQHQEIEQAIREFALKKQCKLKEIAQSLRAALTGSLKSAGLFYFIEVLGKNLTINRLHNAMKKL